jgi:hypothetical protein
MKMCDYPVPRPTPFGQPTPPSGGPQIVVFAIGPDKGEASVTRRAPPTRDAKSNSQPKPAPTFTLSEADITSTRAVPRPRLPGVLGATAAAQAFGATEIAAHSDHDGPPNPARSGRRTAQRPAPDGDA